MAKVVFISDDGSEKILYDRENLSPSEIFYASDYIVCKLWSKQDILDEIRNMNYIDTSMFTSQNEYDAELNRLADKVLNDEEALNKIQQLENCSEGEWYQVHSAIEGVLGLEPSE